MQNVTIKVGSWGNAAKILFLTLVQNMVSLACVGIAGYLVVHDRSAWGWFLIVGWLANRGIPEGVFSSCP